MICVTIKQFYIAFRQRTGLFVCRLVFEGNFQVGVLVLCRRGRICAIYCTLTPLLFPKQVLVFTCLQYKSFENIEGKGEIARHEHFLLFPQCFLPVWGGFCHFHQIWNCRLQTIPVWKSLNLSLRKGLKQTSMFTALLSSRYFIEEDNVQDQAVVNGIVAIPLAYK